MLRLLKNPGSKYRAKAFWAWNGRLDKEELIRQVHVFKEMGMGGFFMHARAGLATEYLGEHWFDCIRACAAEASRLGMEAYLYDEDRYPSGTCAGYAAIEPDFRSKYIYLDMPDEFVAKDYQNIIAVFSATFSGENIVSYEKYREGCAGKILVFYCDESEKLPEYSGSTYLDTLNIEATQNFIKLTHERYKEQCGDLLGRELCGIFTDEVHRGSMFCEFLVGFQGNRMRIPYTAKLFDRFEDMFGYKMQPYLPQLFFRKKGETLSKIMWQYSELLQQLFIDNFARPYHEWCKQNNIIVTGHVLQEDTLTAQSVLSGSVMRYYEYMDYPGVDVLCEARKHEWNIKQTVSVSKQLGKEFTLSECYGATGWGMNLEKYKQICDYQSALGITIRCPHLSWYTMKGKAKRDYPASIFFQSCWHRDFDYLEDYFARINHILSQGEPVTDVCVLSPVESVWASLRANSVHDETFLAAAPDIVQTEGIYSKTFYALLDRNVDFDYLDEDLLKRHGNVITNSGVPLLEVNNMRYRAVVISGSKTIRGETFDILRKFVSQGGTAIIYPNTLEYIDAEPAKSGMLDIFERVSDYDALASQLKKKIQINVAAPQSVIYNIRKIGGQYAVFLVNTDRDNSIEEHYITISLPLSAQEIDLRAGELQPVKFAIYDDAVSIKTSFCAGGERMFLLSANGAAAAEKETEKSEVMEVELGDMLDYELCDYNVMVMDYATYSIDGKQIANDYVLNIDETLRKEYGLEQRIEMAVQPWKKQKYCPDYKKALCQLTLEFEFYVQSMPHEIVLALEDSDRHQIYFNGNKIDNKKSGFWCDKCIDKVLLPAKYIKRGRNTITLHTGFADNTDIEPVYLLGFFGVSSDGSTITTLPEKLAFGDISTQGLPFYGDKLIYKTGITSGNVSVQFNESNGGCQQAVFGKVAQKVPFAPYRTSFNDVKGELLLSVSLTRQNTFGAVHNTDKDLVWHGADSFRDLKNGKFSREIVLQKQGILTKPRIFVKR